MEEPTRRRRPVTLMLECLNPVKNANRSTPVKTHETVMLLVHLPSGDGVRVLTTLEDDLYHNSRHAHP